MAASGRAPKQLYSLEVRGRRSGRLISFPVVVADYDDERYLVAMLGEGVNWVANVRAAGGQAVLRHGRREEVRLEEVDPKFRGAILRRYLELAPGARAHVVVDRSAPLDEFNAVAAAYPVFRIRPSSDRSIESRFDAPGNPGRVPPAASRCLCLRLAGAAETRRQRPAPPGSQRWRPHGLAHPLAGLPLIGEPAGAGAACDLANSEPLGPATWTAVAVAAALVGARSGSQSRISERSEPRPPRRGR